MTPEQFNELVTLLGQIGQSAYDLAVRQALIDGVIATLFALLAFALSLVCLRAARRRCLTAQATDSGWSVWSPNSKGSETAFLFYALGTILLIFALVEVAIALPLLLNPGWAALARLVALVN